MIREVLFHRDKVVERELPRGIKLDKEVEIAIWSLFPLDTGSRDLYRPETVAVLEVRELIAKGRLRLSQRFFLRDPSFRSLCLLPFTVHHANPDGVFSR